MADRPGCVARQAMTAALSNMIAANKKGAPGRCQAAFGPMKCAKLYVKSAGPIKPVKPLMLAMAPWSWPCSELLTRRVISAWVAGPARPPKGHDGNAQAKDPSLRRNAVD